MPDDSNIKLLKIEAQRAQTFLFKVPRLADMDGANALLGDLFRRQLPQALSKYLAAPPHLEQAAAILRVELKAAADDPVASADPSAKEAQEVGWQDAPLAAFSKGILVRDGGRFWGLVASDNVEAAKAAAAATIQAQCPGLGYAFHVGDLGNEEAPEDTPSETATDLVALPCFRWAEDGGDEPASSRITYWRENGEEEQRFVSRATKRKRDARKSRRELWDIASLLKTGEEIPQPTNESDKIDFTDIADGHYLAVIHMDGNGIGPRSKEHANKLQEKDFISRQAKMEAFFFGMRSSMRAAVASALNEHFTDCPDHYRLLMLGGDDVLIVCRADKALPLVTSVAKKLGDHPLADGGPLTMGAGIAIAKPKLPFHRLHELAEQLASSAKRIAIGPKNQDGKGARRSVVDWLITTSSWVDSVDAHRARWERVRYSTEDGAEILLLTGKPYPILEASEFDKSEDPPEPSLEALLTFCKAMRKKFYEDDPEKEGIRSQLKHFLGELRKGKIYAELAWAELPERVRKYFQEYFNEHPRAGFHPPKPDGRNLWLDLDDSIHRCWVADAIELVELQQIGRRQEDDNDQQAPEQRKAGKVA